VNAVTAERIRFNSVASGFSCVAGDISLRNWYSFIFHCSSRSLS